MSNTPTKTMEYIYQSTQIHFLVNPKEKHVMINATEMAKLFNKRIDVFLKSGNTKAFIENLENKLAEFPPYGGNSKIKAIESRGHQGTYMHEVLALKFAAWLDVDFELWVYVTIRDILTRDSKKIKEASSLTNSKEQKLNKIINQVKTSDNQQAKDLLVALDEYEQANKAKTNAIRNFTRQLKMEL